MAHSKAQEAAELADAELTALERIEAMDDDARRRFLTWLATHGGDAFILLVQMDKFERATVIDTDRQLTCRNCQEPR